MKQITKFIVSEYPLELGVLAFGSVVLLSVFVAINDAFKAYLPALVLLIAVTVVIVGFVVLIGKASPEQKGSILKSAVTTGWVIVALILSPVLLPLGLYFLPTIIARQRKHRNLLAIFVLNLCLTPAFGVGWVVALVWAFLKQETV